MKKIYLLLISLVFCFACEKNNISGNEYTVIEFQPNVKYPIFENAKSTTLEFKEIQSIELIIKDLVSRIIDRHNLELKEYFSKFPDKEFPLEYTKYYRQYIPAINEQGEKVVWINFFCGTPKTDKWKKGIVITRDGGDCYFNLKVNLSTKKYYDLRINGEA